MNQLKLKLVTLKKMLEEVQNNLGMDYKVDESLQDAIDVCSEAIIMCSIKPLHSTSINGDQFMTPPEV
jgi:hypothetical protein